MIKPRAKSVVMAVVVLVLVAVNLVVFTKTTKFTCPGDTQTYTTVRKSRGFPLSYWSHSSMGPAACEFSSLTNTSSTFLLQAVLVDLIVAGAVLMGAQAALNYGRKKK